MCDVGENCFGDYIERSVRAAIETYCIPASIFLVWLFHLSAVIGSVLGHGEWFISLTPLNLGLSAALVLFNIPRKAWLALLIPFVIGFVAEWLGVNKGYIFGN